MDKEENSKIQTNSEKDNNAPSSVNEELEKCRRERDEYLDGWKRARADFLNYKKEEEARIEKFLKFSQESFVRELLPVFDSFELAVSSGRKHGDDIRGLEIIFSQFNDIMRKLGLERIKVKAGDKFNPLEHEAVAEVESEVAAGDIAEEVASGYLFQSKVIRPAKVNLSKGQKKVENVHE